MTKTAADYAWFQRDFASLAVAYCFTLVRGLTPAEAVSRLGGRLGAEGEPPDPGITVVEEAAHAYHRRVDGAHELIAVTTLGPWTLLIEPNGYLGCLEERALPASAGAVWVSHYRNVNAVSSFLWAEDGELRLHFDPLFPEDRMGAAPDALVDEMRRIGFATEAADEGADDGYDDDFDETAPCSEGAFALAEHLTGVAVTPELLRDTVFARALVPVR
ncbi:DUF6461 domain-containing protein [Streptomyces sp. NPDC003691]